jgi:lipoprotein-anchoring transpeptidase ErfK/SrfK
MAGKHRAKRFGWGKIVLLVLVMVLVLGSVGTAYAAMRYDRARVDLILPGVTINGVNVGGMTKAQAVAAVQPSVDRALAVALTIHAGSSTWTKPLSDLGVSADVEAVVDRALAVNQRYSWWSRAYHRFANKPIDQSFTVALRYDPAPVEPFVAAVAKKVRVTGTSASYALVDGKVVMARSHDGKGLKSQRASRDLITDAIHAGQAADVRLPLTIVPAKIRTADVGRAIVVHVETNMLYLYDHFKIIRRYHVATAMQGFVTPDGAWEVVRKAENPTWYNPAPDTWGKDEPLIIPGGPGNPLGTRALYLDAPGIRIHGTPSDSSIGSWASHGCVRMHISESEALYPLVPVGTPVFIVGAPPWGVSDSAGPAG